MRAWVVCRVCGYLLESDGSRQAYKLTREKMEADTPCVGAVCVPCGGCSHCFDAPCRCANEATPSEETGFEMPDSRVIAERESLLSRLRSFHAAAPGGTDE
jgi:hypothetical protein